MAIRPPHCWPTLSEEGKKAKKKKLGFVNQSEKDV